MEAVHEEQSTADNAPSDAKPDSRSSYNRRQARHVVDAMTARIIAVAPGRMAREDWPLDVLVMGRPRPMVVGSGSPGHQELAVHDTHPDRVAAGPLQQA